MNLIGYKNAGFNIIKQGKNAVIGIKQHGDYTEYVAWHYSIVDGETSFYWGRYGMYLDDAEIAFNKKENNIYSG